MSSTKTNSLKGRAGDTPTIYLLVTLLTCEVSEHSRRPQILNHKRCSQQMWEQSWAVVPSQVGNQRLLALPYWKGFWHLFRLKVLRVIFISPSHSGFSHQTSIAETQKSLIPSMKMNVLIQKVQVGCRFCKSHLSFYMLAVQPWSTCLRGSIASEELFHKWHWALIWMRRR